MHRRCLLQSVAGLAGVAVAGCTTTDSDSPTNTASPVASDLVESGSGPFPHDIRVRNAGTDDATVTVQVDRGGETVYRRTHSVPPTDTDRVVAGITEETLPEGRRTVRVSVTHADRTDSVTVSVYDCLGDVFGTVGGPDGPDLTYSIC